MIGDIEGGVVGDISRGSQLGLRQIKAPFDAGFPVDVVSSSVRVK